MRSFLVMAMFAASLTGSAWRQNCELGDAQADADEVSEIGTSASSSPVLVLPNKISFDDDSMSLSCANVTVTDMGDTEE